MNIRTSRIRSAAATLLLVAGLGGATGIASLGGAAGAVASQAPIITVQDEGNHDGAGVDTDGTQGDFRAATTGSVAGPMMDAVPQYKAG